MVRIILLVAGIGGLALWPTATFAQGSPSSAAAQALTELLTARHLDAVAASDTDEPGRFVAALFFPGSQLLVISARCVSPSRFEYLLQQHQYRDVYMELGAAALADSKVFYQDLKADGLRPVPSDAVDIVYERDSVPTIFDGDWKKHNLTESAYKERFTKADAQYARLLSMLANAIR